MLLSLSGLSQDAQVSFDVVVGAVAVSANFHMMTRIADGTGTPLDRGGIERTADVRAQIGVDDFVSRRQTDPL